MLDGGLPDLQLGAVLTALRMKTEGVDELLGFYRALDERLYGLSSPALAVRPLVIPAYGGARDQVNLLPLLGLLLQRLRVPVVFHGTLEGSGRAASAYILREFGVVPSTRLSHAQSCLEQERIVFLPTAVLCPGLAGLLALRNQLGVRNSAHLVAKLIDPFRGAGVVMAAASKPCHRDRMGAFFMATGACALVMESTQGEPIANAHRRPRIEFFDQGERYLLFEQEAHTLKAVAGLPVSVDPAATAAWMRQALAGETPIPQPIVNQLACCLYACGYTDDMNQAKAIAAVEAGSLAPNARPAALLPRASAVAR